MGTVFGGVVPSPNFWTLLGLLFSLFAAFFFSVHQSRPGALLVLASGFMDVVDGAVARATGKVSKRGGFLDSNMDRVGESALYLGLMFTQGFYSFLSGLALASSLLVSYSRSRAEAAGLKAEGVGVGERAERLLILSVGGFIGGPYLYYAVGLVAVVAILTFLQRIYVYGSRLE
jgi:archaetidylinositol phosphate synthase